MFDMDAAYREYAVMVYKFLLSLCYEEELAEELTQETFYQAVRSMDRYDGSCKVSTWLCQIAKHLWYREMERRKRKGTNELTADMESLEKPVEEQLLVKEEKMELFRKVHVLDEISKEIVLLRVTGAFSFKEIAELFGKNENWVRVTYYRVKQKLLKGGEKNEM
jgi:RNA polymerase sigma factor (sigma-70 family)